MVISTDAAAAPRPRQGQELLTQGGEAPQFGDRYGALFENDQQVRVHGVSLYLTDFSKNK